MSATQLNPQAGAATADLSAFEALLTREFKPKSDSAKSAVEVAVKTLAQQALAGTALISDDALASIAAMIKAIDATLTAQINLIMHHEEFQQLESAWRGLHHLVNNTETDETLKIKVYNRNWAALSRRSAAPPGTRARSSSGSTRRSSASSAVSRSAPWWVTTISTTARRMCSCLPTSHRSPRQRTRRSSARPPPLFCRWKAGTNSPIRATSPRSSRPRNTRPGDRCAKAPLPATSA